MTRRRRCDCLWSIAKLVVLAIFGTFYYHVYQFVNTDELDVYGPWWVWELTSEGTRKLEKLTESTEEVDNSNVLNSIREDVLSDQKVRKENVINPVDNPPGRQPLNNHHSPELFEKLRNKRTNSDAKLIAVFEPSEKTMNSFTLDEDLCGGICVVTLNPSPEATKPFNAIVLDSDYFKKRKLPKRNSPKQLFVWMNHKSPYETYNDRWALGAKSKAIFNLTMTYRTDSDVFFPSYSALKLVKEIQKEKLNLPKIYQKKSKFIYWNPSQCGNTRVSRMAYDIIYRLIMAEVNIDFVGKCWDDAEIEPEPIYKFYFSFGNEWHCKDYIDEGIWNALLTNTVPVIWGPKKKDLDKLLPKNSYIFLEDFVSAFELKNYLDYLHADNDAISEYFEWRKESYPKLNSASLQKYQHPSGFCKLCSVLHHLDINEEHVVSSLDHWWFDPELSHCKRPGVSETGLYNEVEYYRKAAALRIEPWYSWRTVNVFTLFQLSKIFKLICFVLYAKTIWRLITSLTLYQVLKKTAPIFLKFFIKKLVLLLSEVFRVVKSFMKTQQKYFRFIRTIKRTFLARLCHRVLNVTFNFILTLLPSSVWHHLEEWKRNYAEDLL